MLDKAIMTKKLEQAIRLIKSGDKSSARDLFLEILKTDPKNSQAWLWMSAVVETDELRQECLEEVLKLDPNNQTAKKGLERLCKRNYYPTTITPMKQVSTGIAYRYAIKPRMVHFSLLLLLMPVFLLQKPMLNKYLSYRALRDPKRYHQTNAEVTGYEIRQRRGGYLLYYVRYRFYVHEKAKWYSGGNSSDDGDTWVSITKKTWERSRKTGTIDVVYLPEDPWTNMLIGLDYDPVFGFGLYWLTVTAINIVTLIQVPVILLNYFRCWKAARREEGRRLWYWETKRIYPNLMPLT